MWLIFCSDFLVKRSRNCKFQLNNGRPRPDFIRPLVLNISCKIFFFSVNFQSYLFSTLARIDCCSSSRTHLQLVNLLFGHFEPPPPMFHENSKDSLFAKLFRKLQVRSWIIWPPIWQWPIVIVSDTLTVTIITENNPKNYNF